MPTFSVAFKFDEDLLLSIDISATSLEDALKKAREMKERTLFAKNVTWVDGHMAVHGVDEI
jgi:hypothetical protein